MRKLSLISISLLTIFMVSCNKNKTVSENPLLQTTWDTPFGVPPFDKIVPEHYIPAFEAAMQRNIAEIDSIVNNTEEPNFDNVILALDNSGEMLRNVSAIFFGVNAASTNDQMQQIESDITPKISTHRDHIMLNEKLFAKVQAVHENQASLNLDSLQTRLLDKTYKRFVRAGANLSQADKDKLKQINEQISVAEVKYGTNLLAENKNFVMEVDSADLAGLPKGVVSAAKEFAVSIEKPEKWAFNLSKPSLIPFITYSDNRDLRKKLYEGYLNRANNGNDNDNKQVIKDIIRLRTEKAHLLGFGSFAEFVLDDVMAKTPANVYSLLDALYTPALKRAKAELAEMKQIKLKETGNEEFESWDWWYYAEKVRKQKYDLDEEMLRPYFSLDNVKRGIFDLSNRLYGVTFRPINAPVYHKECVVYEVLDRDNSHLGVLYMDFHPRPGEKGGGAWCDGFRSQTYKDGKRIAPVVMIVCNFTRGTDGKPALLNIDETETFFHEFGHALHGLFADVKYNGLGGVERDFVELPSQIMENWATEPQMLKLYATHYQTNEVIPDALIQKIQNSALFNQGFATTENVAASLSDMDIHDMKEYKDFDVSKFEIDALNVKRGLIKEIAPRYRYPYFSHIFNGGYATGYYSYKWAEVLDKDAYQAFVESGDIFNRELAASFRKNILSKGGSLDGMVMYEKFRGKQPSREPLLKAHGLLE